MTASTVAVTRTKVDVTVERRELADCPSSEHLAQLAA